MLVRELWRFPVKSLQGDRVAATEVGSKGLVGDRSHALLDVDRGVVLTARRDPRLLFGRGVLRRDGTAAIEVDGRPATDDADALSAWVGKRVRLVGPSEDRATYESARNDVADTDIAAWQGPVGSYHDSTRTQVSIVATGDLGTWDRRRFRANVVVDGDTADHLVGHRIRLGGAVLDVVKKIDRCVMTTRPQPGGIERDLSVLTTIRDTRAMCLAVGALVVESGPVAEGDEVTVLGPLDI